MIARRCFALFVSSATFAAGFAGGGRRGLGGTPTRCDVMRGVERTRCAARAVVIDRRQYGCAKAPFCSLSAALRKLLHPHLRIHAKSNRPPVHSRPSVRTSVRTSLSSLVSDNRSRTVHPGAAAFFRSPSSSRGRAAEYRFPGVQAGFKGIFGPAGILLSRLDIEILPNTIETPSTAMEITINEKRQILRGRNKKKEEKKAEEKQNCALSRGKRGSASKIN